jgi:hypothetical protein
MAFSARPSATWAAVTGQKATGKPVKGLSQLVREATDNGRAIVEMLTGIALDDGAAARDRISAGSILLDRGFGKAVETTLTLQADASGSEALSALADAELERLAQTLGPSPVLSVPMPAARAAHALGAAAVGLLGTELLPEPPPEALEAPLASVPRPVPVPQPDGNETPAPVAPLPVPVRPRRRVFVPSPRVEKAASTDVETAGERPAEEPRPKAGGDGGSNPFRPPRAGTEPQ